MNLWTRVTSNPFHLGKAAANFSIIADYAAAKHPNRFGVLGQNGAIETAGIRRLLRRFLSFRLRH
jgi:hypothetical protein